MRTPQSEIVCKKIVKIFNSYSFDCACWTAKRCGLTSYHYVSIELLYVSSGLSNFRFVLNITDTVNTCVVERFDSLQDLLKYIHTYNIGIELNVHHLISIL